MIIIKNKIKKSFLLICITSNHKDDEGSTQLIKCSNHILLYVNYKNQSNKLKNTKCFWTTKKIKKVGGMLATNFEMLLNKSFKNFK